MGEMSVGKVQKAVNEYLERAKEEGREVTREEIDQVAEAALSEALWEEKDIFGP